MNQKGLAPIIIIFLVIALIGGSLVVYKKLNLPITEYQTPPTNEQSATSSAKPAASSKDEKQPKATPQKTDQTKTSPSPTPKATQTIKTGTLKGKVAGGYYLKVLSDTTVTLKGENISKTAKTDSSGIFTFSGIPIGKYNLSFSHPDYNISDVNNVTVSEGETFYNRTINGFLKDVKTTTIMGTVYVDHNDNRQKDSGDEGLDALIGVYNRVGDGWSLNHNIKADKSGNFTFEVKEDGITYKFEPFDYTFYRKPSPLEFVVEGYGGTKDLSFPYYPTASTSKLTIYVFNDKNENNVADSDDEYIDYYYADITNISTGKNEKTSVGPQGTSYSYYDYGAYKIKLIAGNDAWAAQYKITKSEDIITITNTSGDQTVKLGAHKLY